jgi:folate-binding protein YgfZ
MFSLDHYRAVREAAAVVDRSSRARLRLTGADRRDYLQGLLTNDVAALGPGQGCYAALLTAQGRMISDMYVYETGEAIVMDLEPALGGTVAAHLDRFIFSEDVQVTNETAATAQLGVFGPASSAVIAAVLSASAVTRDHLEGLPVLGNRTVPWRGGNVLIVRRDELGVSGFDLIVNADDKAALREAIEAAGAIAFDDETAEVLRIEHGRPRFQQDMNDDTIPLEAGIDDRAISMTKGCYVGQEIIVRVLHRGHGRVAKRLVGLAVGSSSEVPNAGDRLRSTTDEREIGVVTSAVWSPAADGPIALGYVHRDFVEEGTVVTIDHGGARLPATVRRSPLAPPSRSADVRQATPADR